MMHIHLTRKKSIRWPVFVAVASAVGLLGLVVPAAAQPAAQAAPAAAPMATPPPIPPIFSADLRVILYRVYMPAGNDFGAVPLPKLSYRDTTTGIVTPIRTCPQFVTDSNFATGGGNARTGDWGGSTLRDILNRARGQLGVSRNAAFPYCGPWFRVGYSTPTTPGLNYGWIDTNASYWVYPYLAGKNREVLVNGVYPDARYMSIVSYTNDAAFYNYNGLNSWIDDFQINPLPGSKNPFQEQAAPGGNWQVTVKADPQPGESNAIPMYPSGTQPTPGNPFALNPQCYKRASLAACPIDNMFSRPASEIQSSVWSNPDNAYVISFQISHPMNRGDVLVIRGKEPITPTGSHPVVWPNNAAYQSRYFSVCSPGLIYPGYVFSLNSCADGDQMVTDANGYYTVVFSTRGSRPSNATTANGVNWIQSPPPGLPSGIIFRFMLTSSNFAQAPQNAPKNSDWRSAYSVMGDYYPVDTLMCTTWRYEAEGPSGCFAKP